MSDIGRKSQGGKFYALSAESQSFHNILNDFEELGIDSSNNQEEKKLYKDLRNQYLIENNIDRQEYDNAVKQYQELTKRGEDLRFGDGGFLGFNTSPPKFLKALADATGFINIKPIFPTNSPTALGTEDNAA